MPRHVLFYLYLLCGLVFVMSSLLKLEKMLITVNFLLIPILLLLYRKKAEHLFIPVVAALLLMYLRDILLTLGYRDYTGYIMVAHTVALVVLLLCAITMLSRGRLDPLEYFSFLIMSAFLVFVFIFMADMVPDLLSQYRTLMYIYLLLLVLFLGVSFTAYILKSHYGTLWLMLSSAALLFSEVSLFFKLFILEDYSVNLFFPVFHVLAYYCLMEHGRNRRDRRLFLW